MTSIRENQPRYAANHDSPVPDLPGRVPAVLLGDLSMLRCFVGTGIPFVLASDSEDDLTLRSRHATQTALVAPASDTDRALSDLTHLGASIPRRPVLYYGNDAQLLLVSRHRERLGIYYRFRLPPEDLLEDLTDKHRFARLAIQKGIPVPASVGAGEVSGVDELLRRITLPCVVKPNVHIGWFEHVGLHHDGPAKALRADTADELERLVKRVSKHTDDFVVQEYIPGGAEQIVSFHAYMNERAEPLGWFVGQKIRTFPQEVGLSTYVETIHDQEVAELGHDVVRRLRLPGPVKIDMKRDPRSGKLSVLELNTRFNLWNYVGAAAGVNLPLIAHADLTGEPIPKYEGYRAGVRWLSFGNDLRAFLRGYRPSGALSAPQYLSSLRGQKVYEIFDATDPLPYAACVSRYCKALTKRLVQRVAP